MDKSIMMPGGAFKPSDLLNNGTVGFCHYRPEAGETDSP